MRAGCKVGYHRRGSSVVVGSSGRFDRKMIGFNVVILVMRFILVIKYGLLQTKTERIDVNFCENTQQLLEYIGKRVG